MPVFVALSLLAAGPGTAQTNAAVPVQVAPAPASIPLVLAPSAKGPTDKRIEHIHIEDAGSRIDELRVGGETQTITVSPKGGMPAYEVEPNTGNRSPATTERGSAGASGGTRVWKILGF